MHTFQNEKELFNFLNPVLKIRVKSFTKKNHKVTEEEIFQYLKKEVWMNKKNLHLYEMVEDILNKEIMIEK